VEPLNSSFSVDGVLPIDKPIGMTSKDVSRWLEKRVGKLKMGHAGTLDPAASGVLPILMGRATKLQDYLVGDIKAYEFDVEFGIETDTLDSEGITVNRANWDHLSIELLNDAVESFKGVNEQIPPMHSAIKWRGKPLYEYARDNRLNSADMAQFKRKIFIRDMRLVRWTPPVATLQVTCSKGTYVRCLGRDLAYHVGTVGSLTRLMRTLASGFSLKECCSLDDLEKALNAGNSQSHQSNLGILKSYLVPINRLKLGVPTLRVNSEQSKRLLFGQVIRLESSDLSGSGLPNSSFGAMNLGELPEDTEKRLIYDQENSFPEGPAVVVLSSDDRALGIAHGVVLQNGQMTLKLRRGL
jgi:tRNA pseudouridine55 synthase